VNDDLGALALSLDDVVRAVPGVVSLFAADPVLLRSTRQLTAHQAALALVTVTRSGESAEVTVSVGVGGGIQAPDTAAAVAAAVREALPWPDAIVHVRISRVSSS
jgi:hypothetical protein